MQNDYYKVKCDNYGKPIRLTIFYDHYGTLDYLIFKYLECVKIEIFGRKTINLLPRQLKILSVIKIFNNLIVPKTLLEIIVMEHSCEIYILLPKNLRVISADFASRSGFGLLPKYLHNVTIGLLDANMTLSKSLRCLSKCDSFAVTNIGLPKNLKQFDTGYTFDQFIELPKGLKRLSLGNSFNQYVVLPKYIMRLKTGYWFDQNIVLPESIIGLSFVGNAKLSMTDNIPNRLCWLKLPCLPTFNKHPYAYFTHNLPNGVKM